MNQELLSPNQNDTSRPSNRELVVLNNGNISSKRKHQQGLTNLSDKGKEILHQADPSRIPREIAKTGVDIVDTSTKSGVSIFKSIFDKIKETVNSGNVNPNVKNISFSVVGGIFGLNANKKLLDLPKILTNKEKRAKGAPLILDAAKLLTGGALATGIIRGVLGGAGLSGTSIVLGIGIFTALNALTSTYENPDSFFGRIAQLFGLRDKSVSLMDTVKFESQSAENIENTV